MLARPKIWIRPTYEAAWWKVWLCDTVFDYSVTRWRVVILWWLSLSVLWLLLKKANSTQSWNVDLNSPTTENVFIETTKYLLLHLNREYKQQTEQWNLKYIMLDLDSLHADVSYFLPPAEKGRLRNGVANRVPVSCCSDFKFRINYDNSFVFCARIVSLWSLHDRRSNRTKRRNLNFLTEALRTAFTGDDVTSELRSFDNDLPTPPKEFASREKPKFLRCPFLVSRSFFYCRSCLESFGTIIAKKFVLDFFHVGVRPLRFRNFPTHDLQIYGDVSCTMNWRERISSWILNSLRLFARFLSLFFRIVEKRNTQSDMFLSMENPAKCSRIHYLEHFPTIANQSCF